MFSGATCDAPRWPTKRMALNSGERMVVEYSVAAKLVYDVVQRLEFCVGGCRYAANATDEKHSFSSESA